MRASDSSQWRGELLAHRVQHSCPFLHTDIAYCELSQICHGKGRGKITTKAYIAILISSATKAMHLEVVGDLTTAAFIEVLRRFMS
jgi:hypothetical protein